jgi:hypothetical protein
LEDASRLVPFGDADAEAFLDGDGELEGVEGIEPEAFPEEGRVVIDVLWALVREVEFVDDDLLDLCGK